MLSHAVAALRCPVCQGAFQLKEDQPRSLACGAGHTFDAAKQGYFNLLTGKGTVFEADSADMVAARYRFLEGGHYSALADAVADVAEGVLRRPDALVLDAGTGTGHYLRAVTAKSGASAVGLDISKFALRRAARLNPEAANLVWDIWRPLPMADHSADVVMVVFAPRNPAEFARVLRPGGTLVVVTPRPGHLAEIAARTGMLGIEDGKEERLVDSMRAHFASGDSHTLDIPLLLSGPEVADLAFMGPAGHHLHSGQLSGLAESDASTTTTAMFRISVFTVS
ncbi:23S rRNA m(1)G-748 methyltransferase [Arthrobacter sp. yr096]|uniref:methyltransferase domain-containing protein n=1 Tax=unclassified Arthrobacter TaxID=235627 RepID=UPI0008941C3F|nr:MULTISPECIES: methyltransferase domain-containing protein [unclassified Arthrobacter]SDW52288.1 23S rRNA m(1)G-748 methyltransferase [Arthrobacter sp. cf158]SEJ04817.1 23S rRNA m(1)G-748 methyltransferase [Arthrobacter sp. yr096]